MGKIPATVGILTFNSAKKLARALESVRDFDDIVICDGGSTDNTLETAAMYGARTILQDPVYKNPDGTLKDYAGVRNQVLTAARYDWFFYLDSDELASPELVAEIREVSANPHPAHLVYNISPRILLEGRIIRRSSNYPGWQMRFFNRKSGARFRKPVHERITFDRRAYPPGYLTGHWYYEIPTEAASIEKTKRYALGEARAYGPRSLGPFVVFIARKVVTIIKITLKMLVNAFLPGHMPLRLEWQRIAYQGRIIGYAFLQFVGISV